MKLFLVISDVNEYFEVRQLKKFFPSGYDYRVNLLLVKLYPNLIQFRILIGTGYRLFKVNIGMPPL